jgi:hypothetical protein
MAGVRPVARTEMRLRIQGERVTRWARSLRCFATVDHDGFLAISRRAGLARRLLILDRTPGNHTAMLGIQLGYPTCCCRAAARIGEEGIDRWAAAYRDRRFIGRYRQIDPRHYAAGFGLISHVPCTTTCWKSLRLATDLRKASDRNVRRFRFDRTSDTQTTLKSE